MKLPPFSIIRSQEETTNSCVLNQGTFADSATSFLITSRWGLECESDYMNMKPIRLNLGHL